MHKQLNHHVKTTTKILNTGYMKTLRAKNSAQLITLVSDEGRTLHLRVVKTSRFIGYSAGFWPNFTPVFANR